MSRLSPRTPISAAIGLSLIALAAALVPGASASAATPEIGHETDDTLSNLSVEERTLFFSGEPSIVSVDPRTGEFLSVRSAPAVAQPFGVFTNCAGDRACWTAQVPLIWYGFNGSGATGTRPSRGDFKTHDYRAKLCWSYAGGSPCMTGFSGLNQTIAFGALVTGTSVELTR